MGNSLDTCSALGWSGLSSQSEMKFDYMFICEDWIWDFKICIMTWSKKSQRVGG